MKKFLGWFKGLSKLGKVGVIFGVIIVLGVFSNAVSPPEENISQPKEETKTEVAQKEQSEEFSEIEITDVVYEDNKVRVTGTTDLPNGSQLIVDFDVAGRLPESLYIGIDVKVEVKDGKFTAVLTPPQREEFKDGPYEVTVSFTPRAQSDDVLSLVGKNGENLSGDLIEEFGSFKTMEVIEKISLQLSIELPSYTFQEPSEFQTGIAEHTLAGYILAWKDQDWERMVEFTQLTWRENEKDPVEALEAQYDLKTLKGFEIIDSEKISEVTTDITFVVWYELFTNQIDKKQIVARVIKESVPYTPDEQGQWGVNPISALREETLAE